MVRPLKAPFTNAGSLGATVTIPLATPTPPIKYGAIVAMSPVTVVVSLYSLSSVKTLSDLTPATLPILCINALFNESL